MSSPHIQKVFLSSNPAERQYKAQFEVMFEDSVPTLTVRMKVSEHDGAVVRVIEETRISTPLKEKFILTWNGEDAQGNPVPPGGYDPHLEAEAEDTFTRYTECRGGIAVWVLP